MNRTILIKSCRAFRERQSACEATWVGELRAKQATVWIVEGGHDQSAISRGMFGGHILLTCGDAYGVNSIKLRDALRTVLARCAFDFVFVCDDDTFIHPGRWLARDPAGELECRVFWPADKRRNDGLPWVHGGGGWWMSRRLAMFYAMHPMGNTSADDILIANVARFHGIDMIDRPDLYAGDRYSGHAHRVAADNTFITSHHVQPDEMRQLYEATRGL